MRASMRDDLKTAIKAKDRVAVTALRSALSAIENAEALPLDETPTGVSGSEHVAGASVGLRATEATRRELTEAELQAIVADEVRDRVTTGAEYERLGQAEAAARLRAEAAVLDRYLDQQD